MSLRGLSVENFLVTWHAEHCVFLPLLLLLLGVFPSEDAYFLQHEAFGVDDELEAVLVDELVGVSMSLREPSASIPAVAEEELSRPRGVKVPKPKPTTVSRRDEDTSGANELPLGLASALASASSERSESDFDIDSRRVTRGRGNGDGGVVGVTFENGIQPHALPSERSAKIHYGYGIIQNYFPNVHPHLSKCLDPQLMSTHN